MQVESEPGFAKRAQYYAAKTYIEQRERGVNYHDLKEVTMLCITSFPLFPETNAYLSHHVILDKETHVQQLKDFSFSFLELAKFRKRKNELVTMVEKWAYFFKYSKKTSEPDLKDIIGGDRIMERAYHELSRFAWTPENLMEYTLPSILSTQEVQRILKAVSHIKGRTLLMVIYSAGLRVSEALKLRVKDIDSDRTTWHIRCAKGGEDRYVIPCGLPSVT